MDQNVRKGVNYLYIQKTLVRNINSLNSDLVRIKFISKNKSIYAVNLRQITSLNFIIIQCLSKKENMTNIIRRVLKLRISIKRAYLMICVTESR